MIAAIVCLCASFAAAQAKPNFTGTWKMNPSKSKFDGGGGPSGITAKIDQKDDSVTEALTVTGDGGDQNVEGKYTTDGKEIDVQLGPNGAKGTAKWDGDALVIEWKAEGFVFRRKLALSTDGKTLTMAVHRTSQNGEVDETVVFDKQ
jgi:hypothetical protein